MTTNLAAAIGNLPASARPHVAAALRDPARAPYVRACLASSNPVACLKKLAKEDVAILSGAVVAMDGRPIIFPEIAREVDQVVERVASGLASASPHLRYGWRADMTRRIMTLSPDPRRHLDHWLHAVALESLGDFAGAELVAKGIEDDIRRTAHETGMGDLSRYVGKIGDWFERAWDKGYLKYALGAAAIYGVGSAIGWDNIWGGIKSVASAVGNTVEKVFDSVFGGKKGDEPAPAETPKTPVALDKTLLEDQALLAAEAFEKGGEAAAEPHLKKMFEHLVAAGFDEATAVETIKTLVQGAAAMRQQAKAEGRPVPRGGAPAAADLGKMAIPLLGAGLVVVIALGSDKGGSEGRGQRRKRRGE